MIKKRVLLACCAIAVLPLLSGCFIDGPVSHPVISYEGEFDTADDGLALDGKIVNQGAPSESGAFEDVGVYLYDANKTLLSSTTVDRFNGSARISVNSSQKPKYIIIYSPDFWESDSLLNSNSEGTVVDYYVRMDGVYSPDSASSEEDLPVVPERAK